MSLFYDFKLTHIENENFKNFTIQELKGKYSNLQ